jgi:hypothetical protein
MTAAKKSAKKKPRVHRMMIKANKTFKPNPLKLKRGELLKIVGPGVRDVDITVTIDVGKPGGGGGPVTIHS